MTAADLERRIDDVVARLRRKYFLLGLLAGVIGGLLADSFRAW